MQIQFPRRVPWYGLTLRQLGYLVVAGIIAGAIVLFGPVEGTGLMVRVLIGLAIISIGVALAFFRKDGLTAEQWLFTQIKFWLQPHKRVWTRGENASPRDQVAEILIDTAAPAADQVLPAAADDEAEWVRPRLLQPSAPAHKTSQAVIVLIDMAMLLSLFALVVYLARGGLAEIQGWLAR